MSANALNAAFVSSPHIFAMVFDASLASHTDFTSDGSLYEFTAPRRHPGGGAATVKEVSARKVAAKRVLKSILSWCMDVEFVGGFCGSDAWDKAWIKECGLRLKSDSK
jgi:hypothetical protein